MRPDPSLPQERAGGALPHGRPESHGASQDAPQGAPERQAAGQQNQDYQVHPAVLPAQELARAVPQGGQPVLYLHSVTQLAAGHQRVR